MRDVIVVGAGPAGSLAAKTLAKDGYDIEVLEEHPVPGLPQHCTGFVSDQTIAMSGVEPDIISTIYGADVVFPDGRSVHVHSKNPKGRIVDRVDMERKMVDGALNAGACFSFNDRYASHSVKGGVSVRSTTGTHGSRLLVGADGHSSKIALSLGNNAPAEYVRGIQADVRLRMDDQDHFKAYLGNNVAPGFFAWQMPCGDFTRIGLCVGSAADHPYSYLKALLVRLGVEDRVDRLFCGKIPLGGRSVTYGDRVLLAGDAAGLVKAVSGGGLYPAFRANQHLIGAAEAALESDSFSSKDLSRYEKGWKGDMGRSLAFGYFMRKRYNGMSDADLGKAYSWVSKPDVRSKLDEVDIDNPGDIAKAILRDPASFCRGIGMILRSIV